MSDLRHLWKRHNRYYLRLAIPPALRKHFVSKDGKGKPRDKIIEPLSGDLRQAQALRTQRLAYWQAVFERVRTGAPLSAAEIAEESRRAYADTIARSKTLPPVDDIELKAMQAMEDREIERSVGPVIAGIAVERGVTIEPKTDTWRALGRALVQAMATAKGLPLPAALANVTNVRRELEAETEAPISFAPQSAPADGELFSEALAAHLSDLERSGAARATLTDYRKEGEAFIAFAKDVPIASIKRAQVSDFLDHLAKGGASNRTINKYSGLLAAVIDCAVRRGRFDEDKNNPFRDQQRKVETNHYEAFTVEELISLFAKVSFETKPKRYDARSALPWAMAIAAYTGARLEEIAQLRRIDLCKIDGGWCFGITPEASVSGRLKNAASHRLVPVHSKLIELGLLKYHAALPRDADRLFPNLPKRVSKGGKFGPAIGESLEWKRLRQETVRPGLNFHSFRHTVTTTLDGVGVSETDAARVVGHAVEGVTFGTYSWRGPGLVRLRDIVEKITYPGLSV
jgi:integrase